MARRERLQKTNAMRELEAAGVDFSFETYEADEGDDSSELGLRVAQALGEDPASSFKTLVCVAPEAGHVVCCIPVADELDLKKAAVAAGEKSLSLMHVRDLEPTTGYVRGGCSPVGMRKRFPTLIDETAQLFDLIHVSGGRRGLSLALDPADLAAFCGASFSDLVRDGR
jgi:Cys-tRNA(Pro)/Cys-tRNA(Cys) deacylase